MEAAGVPLRELLLFTVLTCGLAAIMFLPALSDFGSVLYGRGDIEFFTWLFWHYETALDEGKNPFFATEIFYPYGASLFATTITPLTAGIYLLLPDGWGAFGRITIIQMLSFILGGVFSFALAWRFTRGFLPSAIASVVFNFSAMHFEKVLQHLNYGMAMAFLPLLFLCYYALLEAPRDRKRMLAFSLAISALTLSELVAAVMAMFIIGIDVFRRYLAHAKIEPFTPRNAVIACAGSLFSLGLFEVSVAAGLPPLLIHVFPSAIFIAICVYFILGLGNLLSAEKRHGYAFSLAACSLPLVAYLGALALFQPYAVESESLLVNAFQFGVPVDFFFLPSGVQAISALGSLPAGSETAVFIGPVALALFVASFLGKAGSDEKHARGMALTAILVSFPLIAVWRIALMATPFIVGHIFPLLGLLRVQSRFMMFAFLFLGLVAALASKRLAEGKGRLGTTLMLAILLLVTAERWPALENFRFDSSVPQFYQRLVSEGGNQTIFLYPNMDYNALLREVYFQTLHGRAMSAGTLSRFPSGGNPLFSLYDANATEPGDVAALAAGLGYDYAVVQKRTCSRRNYECLMGLTEGIEESDLAPLRRAMEQGFGPQAYEDDFRIIYSAKPEPQ